MAWRKPAAGRSGGDARLGLGLILVLALLLRATIPAGWMPDTEAGAPGPLVICTGMGPEVLPGKAPPAAPHAGGHHDVCAFSGLSAAPAPIGPPLAEPALYARLQAPPAAFAGDPPREARRRPQSARGPPGQA